LDKNIDQGVLNPLTKDKTYAFINNLNEFIGIVQSRKLIGTEPISGFSQKFLNESKAGTAIEEFFIKTLKMDIKKYRAIIRLFTQKILNCIIILMH